MAGNLTLAMIKPHAVFKKQSGKIISDLEAAGFSIVHCKMFQLREEGARLFYEEHEGKDFYPYLCKVMISGPVLVMVLAKNNCVEDWRNLIGATNPREAAEGTLRAKYGEKADITLNAVHGSATDHDALREINFFFHRDLAILAEEEKEDVIDNQPGL